MYTAVYKQHCVINDHLTSKASSQPSNTGLKYGCATIYDVDLVAVNFTGAVKLMDCVIFMGIMYNQGELPTSLVFRTNKQPANKDTMVLKCNCFCNFTALP